MFIHPSHWPVPRREKPRIWDLEGRINDQQVRDFFGIKLTEEQRRAFWNAPAQFAWEDAGGAMIRRFEAMKKGT